MPNEKKRQGTNKLPFGAILKKIMDDRGLSVRAVAELAGVSPSVAQSWISKANPHDLQSVARLAKGLNISFKELLLGESETSNMTQLSVEDLFEEKDLFEGICKISIQRLTPRKGSKDE